MINNLVCQDYNHFSPEFIDTFEVPEIYVEQVLIPSLEGISREETVELSVSFSLDEEYLMKGYKNVVFFPTEKLTERLWIQSDLLKSIYKKLSNETKRIFIQLITF